MENDINSFWNWFVQHSKTFNKKQDSWGKELSKHLKQVHPDLTFLIGKPKTNFKKELIVSANGIKAAFPYVIDIVNSAPKLKDWKIIAFKPKIKVKGTIRYNGLEVDSKQIYFDYRLSDGRLDITLFFKNYNPSDKRFMGVAFIMLDNTIGEYNVATKIGSVELKSLPQNHQNLIPLEELDAFISDLQL